MDNCKIITVKVKFDEFLHDTGRAILIDIQGKEVWLGYHMFKHLVINKKMAGHLEISAKTAQEKDIEYKDSDAVVIKKTHIPKKIDFSKKSINKELLR